MDDSQPPNKRRRVGATAALSRPFKSPLRKPEAIDSGSSPLPPCTPRVSKAPQNGTSSLAALTPGPNLSASSLLSSPATHIRRPTKRSALTTPTRSSLADPELLVLQTQERTLQSRLARLRAERDTAKQALRIETSSKFAELEGLIMKWRLVSQEAADEVFAGAQQRVTQMGGLAVWRERSKRDTLQWDYEEKEKEHADEYEEEEGALADALAEKNGSVVEDAELQNEVHMPVALLYWMEQELTSVSQDFTMEFMLKTLNIDLKLIGYDPAMGKWIRD
ncbi:uncharacterized protein N7482_006018 [Penicillium canariense]|uniref:Swi5-dependent recombination DNA repair protein 1 n=1 Tax=Penicillium canariense TaxID=189055 RepID=A0A9W9I948_9EURO|nr:uncharacterized protein N7482_006018 [Penicillium canariense]KAJ5167237.1 hypothetical protein N7482_006018 [Penicillium canariense]